MSRHCGRLCRAGGVPGLSATCMQTADFLADTAAIGNASEALAERFLADVRRQLQPRTRGSGRLEQAFKRLCSMESAGCGSRRRQPAEVRHAPPASMRHICWAAAAQERHHCHLRRIAILLYRCVQAATSVGLRDHPYACVYACMQHHDTPAHRGNTNTRACVRRSASK